MANYPSAFGGAAPSDEQKMLIALAIVVVLVIILMSPPAAAFRAKMKARFSAYPTLKHTTAAQTGNNWSNWQHGSGHAGWGGPMDTPTSSALNQPMMAMSNAGWAKAYGEPYAAGGSVGGCGAGADADAANQAAALAHMGAYTPQ